VGLGTVALFVVIALALVLVLGAEQTSPVPSASDSPYRGLRAESPAGAGVAASPGGISVDGWLVPAVTTAKISVDGWLVPAVTTAKISVDGWLVPAVAQPVAQPYDPMQQGALYDPRANIAVSQSPGGSAVSSYRGVLE
jgi:hypothetical protein